jgi:hypothetical protein
MKTVGTARRLELEDAELDADLDLRTAVGTLDAADEHLAGLVGPGTEEFAQVG